MLHIAPSRIYIQQADNVQLAEHVSCRYIDYCYDLEQKLRAFHDYNVKNRQVTIASSCL